MSAEEMRFTKTHEWARLEGAIVTVGITAYAVEQLNKEIVFVELPQIGRVVKAGDVFGVVEAVKTAADLYSPVSGTITEINEALSANPNLLAEDPFGAGWIAKIALSASEEWDALLTREQYEEIIQNEEHH